MIRICNNSQCGWMGHDHETLRIGGIESLCPQCDETTEGLTYEEAVKSAATRKQGIETMSHWGLIETILEDERDRHIMSGGLATNRKELDAALAFVREMPHRGKPAMQQYTDGNTIIIATRDEWNQRYIDGWNDGNSDAKDDGPQPCDVCDGDGEIEDNSHLSLPVDGDWPMVTCWKCKGTGLQPPDAPQPD